jgi:hypothetical protein
MSVFKLFSCHPTGRRFNRRSTAILDGCLHKNFYSVILRYFVSSAECLFLSFLDGCLRKNYELVLRGAHPIKYSAMHDADKKISVAGEEIRQDIKVINDQRQVVY